MADRRTVAYMVAAGISQERIAACIGENGIESDTLRKHFRRELDTSQQTVTGLAMGSVVRGIKNGEAWATCFYLKCRAGFRETQAHQFVDNEGRDRPFMLADADRIIAAADAEEASREDLEAVNYCNPLGQAARIYGGQARCLTTSASPDRYSLARRPMLSLF